MRKTTKKKPLRLSTETVRQLDDTKLVQVAGGQDWDRKGGGSKTCE